LHDKLGRCWSGNLHSFSNDTGGERKSRLDYDQLARSFHGNVQSDAHDPEPEHDSNPERGADDERSADAHRGDSGRRSARDLLQCAR
jgi:hypothetical protein